MFENILTKENVTFKDLEEIAFKIACEFANEILRNMLEEYDKQVMDSRDTSIYRHKGKETTTIKAKTGLVEYTRTKYIIKDEEGKNKCVYLADELLNIKEMGQISSGIIELIVKNIAEVSYRVCAEMINNMTGLSISGVAVWNIVQQLGEEIKQYEKEKVEAFKEDKLKSGEKETPTIYQADSYHLREKITTHVRDIEDADILKGMFYKKEYSKMIEYVETLKYKYDGEAEEVEKLNELQKYLNKRKNTMKRYKDYDGVKQKLKTYSKITGLKYRNMGCQESNNYCKLTRRMKKKRMSWSVNGSENIAKVITFYASESCTDIIKQLNIQILPESYIEYAKKYIEEIENNIKELKKNKIKTKEIYTFKQGSLEGYPNLKKILENKPISELIYR